jgi:ribosomal-protein-alanine N-acetyltransferase
MKGVKTSPFLCSQRLVLRMPDSTEAESVADYYRRNRQHVANSQALMPESFYTAKHWAETLPRYQQAFEDDQSINLFVFLRNEGERYDDRVIGSVNFTSIIRRAAQFCYLGYSLDENLQGQGYMTEAVGRGIEFAFREKNIHRIMANYVPQNLKSGRVLSRLGFVVEGYARNYLFLNGRWQDHVMTSLTNSNWRFPAP